MAKVEAAKRPNTEYAYFGALAILAMAVGLAAYAFFRQTTDGHVLTGLSDASPWGLYIVGSSSSSGPAPARRSSGS